MIKHVSFCHFIHKEIIETIVFICYNDNGDIFMKFEKVLLASDFDGTLKNDDGIITDDVISAIQYFMSEGGNFTVCTGRIHQGFHLYSKEYINAPVLLGNGAMAYDYENKKMIFHHAIGKEGLPAIENILSHFPDMCIEFYSLNSVTAVNLNEACAHHFTSRDILYKGIDSIYDSELPWTKVMVGAHDKTLEVQKLLDGYPEINYLKTTAEYVEIMKKGVDKGTGLLALASALGCEQKDTYAVGDGYNDVEMLTAAKAGFVPENGSPEALKVAKYVTRSNNNGCVAHAIEILDSIY